MKRYYMNEVFAKNNGSFEFDSVESDYNVYTYENDEDVIKKLATKAGGEYELLTRTMIMHPSMGFRIPVMVFTKPFASCKEDEMLLGVYSSVKDSTLSVEKFYKVLQLLNYSKLVNGTDFTFCIAEKDTIRGFVGSSMDEDKNNIVIEGHYLIATFESWEYFHRMDENLEVMNFEYIYLHMIDDTWKILIKVY